MKGRTQESYWLYIATSILHLRVDEFYNMRPGVVIDMVRMQTAANGLPEHNDL